MLFLAYGQFAPYGGQLRLPFLCRIFLNVCESGAALAALSYPFLFRALGSPARSYLPVTRTAMAAHLVRRCSWLLRAATRLAPAMAPAGRPGLARAAHRTLASSAPSPSSHSSGSWSELLEKEVFTPFAENQEVDQLIEKATGPEELLRLLGSGHCLHQNHAALVLIRLCRLLSEKPEHKATLTQDARLQQLLYLINSQVGSGACPGVLTSKGQHRQCMWLPLWPRWPCTKQPLFPGRDRPTVRSVPHHPVASAVAEVAQLCLVLSVLTAVTR